MAAVKYVDWADWAEETLGTYGATHELLINPIIYNEISVGFQRIEELDAIL